MKLLFKYNIVVMSKSTKKKPEQPLIELPDLPVSFEAIFDRLKEHYSDELLKRNDAAMARALKVTPNVYQTWKSRKFIPWEIVIKLSRKKRLSLEWVLYGEGSVNTAPQIPVTSEQWLRLREIQVGLLDLLLNLTIAQQNQGYDENRDRQIKIMHAAAGYLQMLSGSWRKEDTASPAESPPNPPSDQSSGTAPQDDEKQPEE